MRAPKMGQSLIEVLLAMAIGIPLVIAGIGLVAPSLRTGQVVGTVQQTAGLGGELLDNIRVYSELDWHGLSGLATDTSSSYYLNTSFSPYTIVPGVEQVAVSSNATYRRYFTVTDTYRDASNNATTTAAGNTYDPSTKQVTVTVLSPNAAASPPLSFASSSWTSTTPLPQSPNNSTNGWANLVTINNCVYAMGGYPGNGFNPTTTIYYTTVTGTGKVGTWATTTPVPQSKSPDFGFDGLVNVAAGPNGYLYMLGSGNSNTATSSVYYAKSNSDCTLGAWTRTTSLPGIMNAGTLIVNKGYIYYVSGYNNNGSTEYAPIHADGTLGAWVTQAIAPQTGASLVWSSGVAYNGYLYIPGGFIDPSTVTSTVFYAAVNASGSIISWKKTTPLPVPLEGTAVVLNGYLYVLGGDVASQKTTYYAPINPDGTVGAWTQGSDMPSTNYTLFDFVQIGNSILSIQPNTANVKATVTVPPTTGGIRFQTYLTRNVSQGHNQTDWSGGPGQIAPVAIPTNTFATSSLGPAPPTTIHYVQNAIGYETGLNKTSSTFAITPSQGDLIVVAIATFNDTVSSVVDTAGNAYNQIRVVSQSTGGSNVIRLYMYYAMNVATSSPFRVTANTGATGEGTIIAIDVNGAATSSVFDQFASAIGISATANSGTLTTTSTGEMYINATTDDTTPGETPGSGYIEIAAQPDNTNFQDLFVEARVIPTATTTSATFTSGDGTSFHWNSILGSFRSVTIPGTSQNAILWSTPGSFQLNL